MPDEKISELDPAGSLNGNEQAELLQVGKNVRASLTTIKAWFLSALNYVYINFIPQTTAPTHDEGLVYYDNNKKALTYYNEESDVSINIGQELVFRVYNSSGSLITNGSVVYPIGTTIGLAEADVKSKSRLIAVATHDIANNSFGYITKIGQVGGLDTSTYSVGDVLYLSETVPGGLTLDMPTDGGFVCIVGVVDTVDATDGVITVDTKTSDITVEVTDTNGFPTDQRAATTLSFVDGTRTLTITPTGSDFHFYELGDKYEKTTSQSAVITNVTGGHIVYFDSGVLTSTANPTSAQAESIIINKCIVAYIYWNTTSAKAEIVQDERHGLMQPIVHYYLHVRFGAFYRSGLALEGFVIGAGSSNTHAQFGNALGVVEDEDITHNISATASTVGLKYYYRLGAAGAFYSGTNAGYSFPVGATPLPQYNQFTGATWQLTEVTSGDYMNLHFFANGAIDHKPFVILGTAEYGTVSAASAGQADELSSILGSLPIPEFVLIGSVIIEGKTSFTNTPNARVVQNSEGQNYTNWTTTELSAGSPPTNHNNLAGLQDAGTGVTWGHVNEALFNSLLSGPASSTDNAIARFDGATGKILQNSAATINDNGKITTIGSTPDIDLESSDTYDTIPNAEINSRFKYNTAGSVTDFCKILFKKTNGIDGETGGSVIIYKKPNAGVSSEALEINEDGNIIIHTAPPTDTTNNDILTWNSTSKAIEKRTQLITSSITSSATPTPTGSARENEYTITALAAAATFAAPSGTPANNNNLMIRIKDNGIARALVWNAIYYAFGQALPTTTILSKAMYVNFIYDSAASKWNLVSVVNEI